MRRRWAGVLMMLAACGGGLKPSGGVGDRAACQAMATSSAPDPYNAAAEEWNRHAAANDDTYGRFTNSGTFQAWPLRMASRLVRDLRRRPRLHQASSPCQT